MQLRGKTILVISPEAWSNFYNSKQNYSIELAKRKNKVFFLNPPNSRNKTISIKQTEIDNLNIIDLPIRKWMILRYHFKAAYNFLMSRFCRKIERELGLTIDILWCFEPKLYFDLCWFNAKFRIFHPVDFIKVEYQLRIAKHADLILSVADNILELFKSYKAPKYFINHGLSSYYSELKLTRPPLEERTKVAYIGSLFIPGIDRDKLSTLIRNNQNIQFDFFGRFDDKPQAAEHILDFIKFLKDQRNVTLNGVMHPKELSVKLSDYDLFLLCYNPSRELNSGSNSHKILEYLSLGRVIVSNWIKAYAKYAADDFILMADSHDNSDYIDKFQYAIENIEKLNSEELQQARRALAMKNTYADHINKIELIIDEHSR